MDNFDFILLSYYTDNFPYAGTCIGLDEMTRIVFSRLGSERIDYKLTPEYYVAGDNKMVAYGTYTGTYKKTGN